MATVVSICNITLTNKNVFIVSKALSGDAMLQTRFRWKTDIGVARVIVQTLLANRLKCFPHHIALISEDGTRLCDWTDDVIRSTGLSPSMDDIDEFVTCLHIQFKNKVPTMFLTRDV